MLTAQKRRADERTKDHIGNKILKVLDNFDKKNSTETSSVRQFFMSLATKAETLTEYRQHMLEMICLQAYSSIKFSSHEGDELQ